MTNEVARPTGIWTSLKMRYVLIVTHNGFAIQYASKIGFSDIDPLVKSSHERPAIYPQYLFWCNLGTPGFDKNILSGRPNSLT